MSYTFYPFCITFIVHQTLSAIRRVPKPLLTGIMDDLRHNDAVKLFQRLKEAEKEAKLLADKIQDIRCEIAVLTESTKSILKEKESLAPSSSFRNNVLSAFSSGKRPLEETDSSHLNNAKKEKNIPLENGYVVVYTDGACENNGRSNAKAGIGVWFGDGNSLNISKPVCGRPTNNTAEIQACIEALRLLSDLGYSKVKIITDSQFTINCITKWIHKWKSNGWKLSTGGAVKNKEDLIKLDCVRQQFEDIKWEHCAGHQGIKGNEEADRLAREGASKYKQ